MKRFALLILLIAVSGNAIAVTVRGRVDIAFPYGVIPMTGANVSLCSVGQGCMNYITGADGMYYFNANPGDHVILVNGVQRMQLFIPAQAHMDIPPLRMN